LILEDSVTGVVEMLAAMTDHYLVQLVVPWLDRWISRETDIRLWSRKIAVFIV